MHDLSESAPRRGWSDFTNRRRVDARRGLAVSAAFGLLVTVFYAWTSEGLSWIRVSWALLATGGAFLAFEVAVLGWLVVASPLRQRREAREEAKRLGGIEREAARCREAFESIRQQLAESHEQIERLQPFEAKTGELSSDLRMTRASLSGANRELQVARREIEALRGSLEGLQRENTFLEQAKLEDILRDAESQHRASAQAFAHHALARYQRDAREAVSQAAARVATDAISFQPYPIGDRKPQSMMALIIGTRTRPREQKILRVDALLPFGTDVPKRAREVAEKLRPHEVHGSLILVDELHERVARQLKSRLEGLDRIEVVPCQRAGAPYDQRLDKALRRLIALPRRSKDDDEKIASWIREDRNT